MKTLGSIALLALSIAASANLRITEWMYSGGSGEFIEFTNVGGSAIDMTGWSFDDDSRLAGTVDLSAFGTVSAGESVILTEAVEATFRTSWALGSGVKIIGGLTTNLGRNDEINLFNASSALEDRLTFGDQNIAGTIRTQNFSGNTGLANLGTNNVAGWSLSSVADAYNSYASTAGDVANPGQYAPVPEPATIAILGLGLAALRRRRS